MSTDKENQSPSVEPLLLKYPEAATVMGMSEAALRELVDRGEIHVIRPSLFAKASSSRTRIVLFPVSELRAWVERQLAEAEPGAA